ncbi:hypothetical protein THAOC_14067, partial [Thalassiosira oceanica]
EQLALGWEVIYDHFVRFGLEMHIGRTVNGKETASKTECVFFPRPSFFSKKKNTPALANEPFDGSIVQSVPVAENAPVETHKPSWREQREASAERAKKKAELEKTRYFSLDQTQPILRPRMASSPSPCTSSISVHSSRTTFGATSILTFTSRRRANPWVLSGTSSITNTSIPTLHQAPYLQSNPTQSTILWGCETWSLREDHYVKIESFLQRSIRNIHTQHQHHDASQGRPHQEKGYPQDVL